MASLTNWVRDLVNASPSDTTPDDMAGHARDMAREAVALVADLVEALANKAR